MTDIIPEDLSRLQSTLVTSGLQIRDNALYQVITGLILNLAKINKVGGKSIIEASKSGGNASSGNTIILSDLDNSSDGGDSDSTPIPGRDGIQGITGSQGPIGPVTFIEDGIDGNDGFNIPNPGPAGSTGAQGPMGPVLLVEDGLDGLDSLIPGPAGSSAGSDFLVSRTQLTNDQIAGLNTTPLTLIAGISTELLVPIFFSIVALKTGNAWTGGNNGFYIAYESNKATSLIENGGSVGLALASGGTIKSFAHVPARITNTAGLTLSGKGIQLVTGADITAGTGGPTTVNIIIVYCIQNPALF